MRKLNSDDMFLLSEIADKMDFQLDVKGKTQEQIGADVLFFLIKRIHRAKDEIKQLISSVSGKSEQEVSEMGPAELINAIKEIAQQDGVVDFFK